MEEKQPDSAWSYNYLDERYLDVEYTHRKEDGSFIAGRSIMTWDDKMIKAEINIPIDFPPERMISTMQHVLDDMWDAAEHEREKKKETNATDVNA